MMTWEQENDKIITEIFSRFLNKTTPDSSSIKSNFKEKGVEFIITPACNQKCEYCYLVKNGDKLYPKEIRNPETILNNLKLILNYFLEENIFPETIDLFSGEIWGEKFGVAILWEILEYVKKAKNPPAMICIPSNCSFILNDKALETINTLIEAFEFYGTRLIFSASVDGYYLETENRSFIDSKKNNLKNDEFYDKLFTWCKKYNFGFHPMVNAYNIEKWPLQYDWWISKMKEYGFSYWNHFMFLEVRDNNWTNEKINSYLDFLNHSFSVVEKEIFNGNKKEMLQVGLGMPKKMKTNLNYYNLALGKNCIGKGCNVDKLISIRLGDLSWVPCHRTSYEKFIYGKLKVENNTIVGVQALNLPLLFSVFGLGFGGHPKCDTCPINNICMRGCYGAQYEEHKELFYPCPTVCNLEKVKNYFLCEKYLKMANEIPDSELQISHLNKIKEQIYSLEEEFINLWKPKIMTLI